MIYAGDRPRLDRIPSPEVPRRDVITELVEAVWHDRLPLHSGEWGLASLEVCLAILESGRSCREIELAFQVGVPS